MINGEKKGGGGGGEKIIMEGCGVGLLVPHFLTRRHWPEPHLAYKMHWRFLTSCNILSKGFNYIFIFHPHFFHHLFFFFFWSFKAFARCLLESMGPSKPPSMGFGSVLCLQLPDDTIWERGCHNTPVFCKRKQKFSVTNCSSYMLWQRLEAILFSHWTHLDSSHANAIIQKFLKRGLQYTAVASGSVSFVEFSADWWQRCRVSLEKQKTGSELSVQ